MASCQPASLTKHLPLIHHPLPRQCLPAGAEQDESILRLKQISSSNSDSRNDTDSSQEKGAGSTGTTGTTLWLGGQLMSCYMAETSPAGSALESGRRRHKRVLELGGGIGFLSLVLASLGYAVTTTDISPSFETVLCPNIETNTRNRSSEWGPIRCRKLDWFAHTGSEEQGITVARSWMTHEDPDPDDSTLDYDYIITTDTLYSTPLTIPLLQTLRSFSLACVTPPPILVALETRDPMLIASALEAAKAMGFSLKKIAAGRVEKALGKSGWGWEDKSEWEGIEIWKWKYTGLA